MMAEIQHTNCSQCSSRFKSVFCELEPYQTQRLNTAKKNIVFKKGEMIFKEGTHPRGLYCVQNGKIKVMQTGIDGKEQIIYLAKNGDIMGYRAILSGDTYSCSAKAIEDSNVCFVPLSLFTGMIETNAKLSLKLLHLLSNELKIAERNITTIAQQPVRERLAQTILLLKESYDVEADGCTINVSITREDIANIVGTARESVIRLLFELQKDKIIELKGKKIKILDHKKLANEANMFY